MSSARPCKFGFTCRRADCWFSHPEGRQIDGAKPAAAAQPQYVVNANAQNFKPPQHQQYYAAAGGAAAAAGYYQQQQPMHGMAPHQLAPANSQAQASAYRSVTRPLTPHAQVAAEGTGAAAAASSSGVAMLSDGKKPCKFGRTCHRKDCHFGHPDGRDIDDSPHSSSASTPKQFVKKSGAREPVSPSDYDLEDDDGLDENTVDALVMAKEWFPAYKDCTCCKGYIHDCEEPTCASLGTCANCAYGKDDDAGAGAGAGGADESWKDEWFGAARGCACCEGYVYRCKQHNSACKAQGKCFCQSAPAAAAAAPAAAGAGAPGGPPA